MSSTGGFHFVFKAEGRWAVCVAGAQRVRWRTGIRLHQFRRDVSFGISDSILHHNG